MRRDETRNGACILLCYDIHTVFDVIHHCTAATWLLLIANNDTVGLSFGILILFPLYLADALKDFGLIGSVSNP